LSIVTPYKQTADSKKEQVRMMFDNIAHRYDFLNHFLSLGIDKRWRKKAISFLQKEKPGLILDIATGTGSFAIEALTLNPEAIKGIDISEQMLERGRQKIKKLKLEKKIELIQGDSEKINFNSESFDAVTVGFGVRNFENLSKGLSEIYRVLKKDGTLVVLEFSNPEKFPVKQAYNFYFQNILPFIGKIISKDKRAYQYLPESVKAFPSGKDFIKLLDNAGFTNTKCLPLSFGIASIYTGKK
jgi:demethylmenaquinone methyltransferase/2-methoxy-6-polyprenyl-1,4-benzoquinol methylase